MRRLLEDSGTDPTFFKQLDREAEDLAVATRQACHSLPDPDLAELFATVYAAPHPLMERQAAEYAAYVFYQLEAPVLRVGSYDMPYPPSRRRARVPAGPGSGARRGGADAGVLGHLGRR